MQVDLRHAVGQVAHVNGGDQDTIGVLGVDIDLVEGDDKGAAVEAEVAGEVGKLVGLRGPHLVEIPVGYRQRNWIGRLGDSDIKYGAVIADKGRIELRSGIDLHAADQEALRLVVENDLRVGEGIAEDVVGIGIGEVALQVEEIFESIHD